MLSKEKQAAIRALTSADGHVEPDDVWQAGRDPSHALHDEFRWDINEAAQEHWRDTARSLIRFVRLEVTVENVSYISPLYVVDPARPPRSQRYVELDRVARDREMAERCMLDELDRITNAIRRAQSVAHVLGLSARLDAMLADVMSLKTRAERAALEKAATRRSPSKRATARKTSRRKVA
jgi:hypothetical protein